MKVKDFQGNYYLYVLCLLILAKILVVGGRSKDKENRPLEIIDLINTKSKPFIVVEKNSRRRDRAIGGILQNQPVICGGGFYSPNYSDNKISVIGMPNQHCFEMMIPSREDMSGVVLNETKIWITGGGCYNALSIRSTEIVSLDQPPIAGPDLPFTVKGHSMVRVDPTMIYLIGGVQNAKVSKKTWIIDPTNDFQIKVGPSMNMGRYWHSCSKMKINGKIYLVVAGHGSPNHSGFIRYAPNNASDSVELLDTTCPEQGWKMGMCNNIVCQNYSYK